MELRLLIFVGFIIALDLYAFQAFRTLIQDWSAAARMTLIVGYWLITALAILALFLTASGATENWNRGSLILLRAGLFITYASKLPIVFFLLIDDLRRLFTWGYASISGKEGIDYGRSKFLSTLAIILGSLPFLTLIYGMVRNRYRYKVFRQQVTVKGLPAALKGLKIVQISDIHSGSFDQKEPVREAVRLINAQQPDLVFFTGDLVNNVAAEAQDFIDVFNKIEAKHGVFSVLGNHDYGDYYRWESRAAKVENMEQMKATHRKMGFRLLLNEHERVTINDTDIAIIGTENWSASPRFKSYGNMEKACNGCEDAPLKLLLSHDPTHWDKEVTEKYQDVDITFSGHTHGMQFGIEIPGWLKWSPAKFVYPHWAGLYQKGEQHLYVNRGLGFLGYPGRVGILPEITVITLA